LPRASEPGVVFGSKAVGEPPSMPAISVREAFASYGPGVVELENPELAPAARAQAGRPAPLHPSAEIVIAR
jgi:xanthine dehydrogenase molybdopterin-binding subunit B